MRILGIDPSITHTAAAWLLEDGSHRESSIISKPKEGVSDMERLDAIRERLKVFVGEPSAMDNWLFVEGFSFGSTGRAVFQIGWLGFELRRMFWESGSWNIVEIPPTSLKVYTAARASATKEAMMQQVLKRWGYEAPDNNAADAYALMQMGAHWLRWKGGEVVNQPTEKTFSKLHAITPKR